MSKIKQIIWIFESKFTMEYVKKCLQTSSYEAYLDTQASELGRLIRELKPDLTIVHAVHFEQVKEMIEEERIYIWDPENKYPEFSLRIASKINSANISSIIESSMEKISNE